MSPWSNDLVSLLKLPLVESSAGGDILTGAGSGRITTVHRRTMELLGCTMFPRHSREIMKNRNSQWTIEKEMWRPEASSAVYKKAFIFFSGRTKKKTRDTIVIVTGLQRCSKAQLSPCALPRQEFWENLGCWEMRLGHVMLKTSFLSSCAQNR